MLSTYPQSCRKECQYNTILLRYVNTIVDPRIRTVNEASVSYNKEHEKTLYILDI
jgi:hypothetical protein